MNFFISILGWFLWNWAEFSVVKQEGDGSEYESDILKFVNAATVLDDNTKIIVSQGIKAILKSPVTLRMYAKTHYETWIGSLGCIFLLLWIGARNLSVDPLAPLFGVETKLGWNDLYLVGSGVVWDAFIFGFKKVRKFFKKKESEL